MARPTKYDPKYCEELIEFMGDPLSPCSFESFAGKIGVSKDSIYEWAKVHKEFSDAKKIADAKGKWVREDKYNLLQVGLMRDPSNPTKIVQAKTVNQAMVIFGMKNQSGWRDRLEISDFEDVDELAFVRTDGK